MEIVGDITDEAVSKYTKAQAEESRKEDSRGHAGGSRPLERQDRELRGNSGRRARDPRRCASTFARNGAPGCRQVLKIPRTTSKSALARRLNYR